jgi:hypothetical protein
MKKFFTILAAFGMSYAATAGTLPTASATLISHPNTHMTPVSRAAGSRALTCDTLLNLNLATSDTNASIFGFQAPNVGYVTGSGALSNNGTFVTITSVGEKFTAPAAGSYVTGASVFMQAILNHTHADSILPLTAYIYDTTGTSLRGTPGPGAPIDSATSSIASVLAFGAANFSFTHQATIAGKGFFIMVKLPQVAGDTLIVISNDNTTNNGKAWLGLSVGFISLDSLSRGGIHLGTYIFADVCKNVVTCPTITVAAAQVGTTTSATATPTGGATPYTYAWSTTPAQTTATATGLTVGTTYNVTATDHNGCTGVGHVTIAPNGITNIAGITEFSVYPNPSNGVFTASISLESASDVTISVVDMTGNKVYESTDKASKDITKQINLGSVAAGIYIVNVKTANGTTNQRISVK